MATTKPDLRRVWAAGAPGANIEDPDVTSPGKYDDGWLAEIPTFENFNFLQQLFTQGLAHINEQGIAQWDTLTEYPLGALVKGSNGILYKSTVAANTGNDPISSPITEWSVALANTNYYLDSGAADAYVLSQAAGSVSQGSYVDGTPVTFRPDISNTGASTVNVEGLGVKNIKTVDGIDPGAGQIEAGVLITLIYDSANGWFEIVSLGGGGQFLGTAAVKAIMFNAQSIDEDITVAADQNAMSAGPITIEDTRTVTIATGGRWVIT